MMKFWFSVVLMAFCMFLCRDIAALDWELVDEDFDDDFGAFTTVEHTGGDRTAEVDDGVAILSRINAAGDIGPTMRAYFDDPGTSEFILHTKIDVKEIDDTSHFIIAMRINGFEYFPTVSVDKIGDHESPEQYDTGIAKQQVDASPIGQHEYVVVGKSEDAYDLYFDGELIIKNGVTRSLGQETWEVAQAMIHVRKGVDTEIHVDFVRVQEGSAGLAGLLAVSPRGKLTWTWAKVKEQ